MLHPQQNTTRPGTTEPSPARCLLPLGTQGQGWRVAVGVTVPRLCAEKENQEHHMEEQ